MKYLFLTAIVGLCACGGSNPAIVQHHVSIEVISQTPPEARTTVANAFRAHYLAELEVEHVQFLLADLGYELQIAKAEAKQLKQRKSLLVLKEKRNAKVFKTAAVAAAKSLLGGLDKKQNAQKERITYLKAQRTYLKKRLHHANALMDHASARFELAKAQLAKKRDILPKGFLLKSFISQENRASEVAASKGKAAKAAQSKAIEKERGWKKAAK